MEKVRVLSKKTTSVYCTQNDIYVFTQLKASKHLSILMMIDLMEFINLNKLGFFWRKTTLFKNSYSLIGEVNENS